VTEYAGLATRTLAFAIDAAIINVVAWFLGGIVALGLSIIGVPDDVVTVLAVIGAGLALAWTIVYFVFFWSTTGQTPGDRILGLRVEHAKTHRPPRARRAFLRVAALPLSAIPLCAGFLLILVDARRRALHDRLVGTVVVYAREQPPSRRVVHVAQPYADVDLSRTNGEQERAVDGRNHADGHVRPDHERRAGHDRQPSA
jgi:uncharacterized RDD family membrane protein YckC